ncbi:Plasmid maintenance system killer protein [Providencia rettgeri]|nr:Plasmid maintenance system killer protein [Providencia rettgeri]
MIKSFKHKGIEHFFKMGITSGIQSKHITKLRVQLTALNVAKKPQDMSAPS